MSRSHGAARCKRKSRQTDASEIARATKREGIDAQRSQDHVQPSKAHPQDQYAEGVDLEAVILEGRGNPSLCVHPLLAQRPEIRIDPDPPLLLPPYKSGEI